MDSLDRWAINETLLQSYRATFISSQSFLLAVGATFAGKNAVLLYVASLYKHARHLVDLGSRRPGTA